MIFGVAGKDIPFSVNFLPSRAGLATVGYQVVDKNHAVVIARTLIGVNEIDFGGNPTGLYTVTLQFSNDFAGFIIWDTGQPANGVGVNKLRIARDEIFITEQVGGAGLATNTSVNNARDEVLDAVKAIYEENVMKIPNTTMPAHIRIVRKKDSDGNWDTPYSDHIVPIIRTPGALRVGGPP
jgi:hypothetical protein